MNASVKSDRLIQERLQRARLHKMQKKKETDLESGCKNKMEDEEIKEDGINLQIPDGCCKTYGRPPKYAVEKLISFAFKQLGLKVVFD